VSSTQDIPFAPIQASTAAASVDHLFLFELSVGMFFVALIFTLIVYFALRYHRRSDDEVPPRVGTHYGLEAAWSIIPFAFMMVYFFWGAKIYVNLKKPVTHAMEVHVTGKQWMWKIEHANGVREINELHVPVGQPVKLIMSSQDVIHDFFIPEFRIKQDVLPGSFVTEWFQATRVGEYHLFCAQYCGTDHSRMVGHVVVMEPAQFQAWLSQAVPSDSPVAAGAKLFSSYGCMTCHGQRSPTMAGLYMSRVTLSDGSVVTADDAYLRESIVNPSTQIVAGYPPIMPPFYQLSEDQIFQLVQYIKSLQTVKAGGGELPGPATRPAPGDQPAMQPNFPPAETPYAPPVIPGGSGNQ